MALNASGQDQNKEQDKSQPHRDPHPSYIDPNQQIGVVPQPRPAPPPRTDFIFKTFNYEGSDQVISLPVRPANLDPQNEQRFRNIVKQIAIDLEKTNRNRFIAYRRTRGAKNDWWQAGGNSVLFYHYRFEKTCKLTPIKTRPDGDFGCKWPDDDQVVMIHSIKHIAEQLQDKVHARRLLVTPELVILEFPVSFSAEAIEGLRKIRHNKKETINRLILPEVVHPHTHQSIAELHRYLANAVLKLTEPQRIAYGYDGLNLIKNLTTRFRYMSNGGIPVKDFYLEASDTIERFCDWLLLVQDIKLIDIDTMYQLVERTTKVKGNIASELQQLQ